MLSDVTVTRLEKAAIDNGFDRELPPEADWLKFGSTHAPLVIWLSAMEDGRPIAALSQQSVANALGDCDRAVGRSTPPSARGVRILTDILSLHQFVRRAFQLSRTLPDELLHVFEAQTQGLPRNTEAERLVIQRVGQDVFRTGLLEYWQGRCAVTGLPVPGLLRASHIKPWADCATDAERLDVFNGLLLIPNIDCAFDQGFITVANDGALLLSSRLTNPERQLLGLDAVLRVSALADRHRHYLAWHREKIFQS
jgi:putative restriction endonuclease